MEWRIHRAKLIPGPQDYGDLKKPRTPGGRFNASKTKTWLEQLIHEKKDEEIVDVDPTPTDRQLSAVLQARLISVTAKEALSIVVAAQGQGVEAWRQLTKPYDRRTDARSALLLISIGKTRVCKRRWSSGSLNSRLSKETTARSSARRSAEHCFSTSCRNQFRLGHSSIWTDW